MVSSFFNSNNCSGSVLVKNLLGVHKRGFAEFAPFWMKYNKSIKEAKSHLYYWFQKWVSNDLFEFFLINGVLGTHKRGCVEFAPFWMKNNSIGTLWKKHSTSKKSHFYGSTNWVTKFFS
jgi:hypothetical protein